jgi:CheY-like chemotaxis protein
MPRRRDITVDCLHIEWDADGAIVSRRVDQRPRPLGYEFGRTLLALAAAPGRAEGGRGSLRAADEAAFPIAEVARLAELTEHETRASLHDLLPTGCLVREPVRLGRRREYAPRSFGFRLAPIHDMRGPARRPRLRPIALVLEPSAACGDLIDILLRRVGLLAVQALDVSEALRLLSWIGFELVVADARAAAESPGYAALARAVRAAGCGPLLATTDAHVRDEQDVRALGPRAAVEKPFAPAAFEAAVTRLGVGTASPVPAFESMGA